MENLTTILFSSLVGALVAYVGAILKNIIDTRSKFDDALFQKRTDVYSKLWAITREVPKYPKREGIKYSDLKEYSERLKVWYYETGGIYMSKKSQRSYAALQEKIWGLMKQEEEADIAESTYKALQEVGSDLRTELTKDLLSRRAAPRI
jgi:hypothetical protein